ncbi:unnamed protein product [Microthlaspi erraticum]|uniref:Uncharacterized protein n=1 Tax=Microthlaspi erraticum TaxID=1685480 RepID=A0A6D2I347_9BRAS|nr:unnamed protein product [Microthlaspi erraticum]
MAIRSRVITMSPLVLNQEADLEIDLDLWEVVNTSDGEYSDDSFSVDSLSDDDVISLDDDSLDSLDVVSLPPEMLPEAAPEMLHEAEAEAGELAADLNLDGDVDGDGDRDNVVPDEVVDTDLGWAHQRLVVIRGGTVVGVTYGDYVNRRGCCYDDDDEDHGGDDGEYDDSYDLDDELVPRSACKKLGRQRMRKLGKRAIAKASKTSKTSPYAHLKAGIVRGKHGIGMKFKY